MDEFAFKKKEVSLAAVQKADQPQDYIDGRHVGTVLMRTCLRQRKFVIHSSYGPVGRNDVVLWSDLSFISGICSVGRRRHREGPCVSCWLGKYWLLIVIIVSNTRIRSVGKNVKLFVNCT